MYTNKNKAYSYVELIVAVSIAMMIFSISFTLIYSISKSQSVTLNYNVRKHQIDKFFAVFGNQFSRSTEVYFYNISRFHSSADLNKKVEVLDGECNLVNIIQYTKDENSKKNMYIDRNNFWHADDKTKNIYYFYREKYKLLQTHFLSDVSVKFILDDNLLIVKLFDMRSKKTYERVYEKQK